MSSCAAAAAKRFSKAGRFHFHSPLPLVAARRKQQWRQQLISAGCCSPFRGASISPAVRCLPAAGSPCRALAPRHCVCCLVGRAARQQMWMLMLMLMMRRRLRQDQLLAPPRCLHGPTIPDPSTFRSEAFAICHSPLLLQCQRWLTTRLAARRVILGAPHHRRAALAPARQLDDAVANPP